MDQQLSGRYDRECCTAHHRSKGTAWAVFEQLRRCKGAINHIYTAGTAGGAQHGVRFCFITYSLARRAADVKDIGSQISGEQ